MTEENIKLDGGMTITFDSDKRHDIDKLATLSIAISLKRIADAMTETNEYGEGTAAAIGGNLRRAMQEISSTVFQAMNGRR